MLFRLEHDIVGKKRKISNKLIEIIHLNKTSVFFLLKEASNKSSSTRHVRYSMSVEDLWQLLMFFREYNCQMG